MTTPLSTDQLLNLLSFTEQATQFLHEAEQSLLSERPNDAMDQIRNAQAWTHATLSTVVSALAPEELPPDHPDPE